ncbi:hypothetical protein [Streptomyces sp. NPDC085665]|uniref:hypothetical protein n=1 Tax=Streptomyces sp. NPDC085665 TaxID=3365735 RepID=UPI0037CE04C8
MSNRARAASLIASALDVAYGGDDTMTISVHAPSGSVFSVTGSTSSEERRAEDVPERDPIDFAPCDLTSLIDWLAQILAGPAAKGAISVRVPDPETSAGELVWVWSLATYGPLRDQEAEEVFPAVEVPTSHGAYGYLTDEYLPADGFFCGPLTPLTGNALYPLMHHR